jgi:hypothetical protein
LGAEGVAEIGVSFFRSWIIEGFVELGEFMDERMFVVEAKARNPPVSSVGMLPVGAMNAAPATAVNTQGAIKVRHEQQLDGSVKSNIELPEGIEQVE